MKKALSGLIVVLMLVGLCSCAQEPEKKAVNATDLKPAIEKLGDVEQIYEKSVSRFVTGETILNYKGNDSLVFIGNLVEYNSLTKGFADYVETITESANAKAHQSYNVTYDENKKYVEFCAYVNKSTGEVVEYEIRVFNGDFINKRGDWYAKSCHFNNTLTRDITNKKDVDFGFTLDVLVLDPDKLPTSRYEYDCKTGSLKMDLISSADDLTEEIVGIMCTRKDLSKLDSTANPNSFYGYYVDEKVHNNGLSYNFVIIIPECVKQAYKDGNGVNPDSGKPFWWYIETYYNCSYSEMESKGREIAETLLNDGKDMAITPKAEDVTGTWLASSSSGSTSSIKLCSSVSDLKDEIVGVVCSSETISSFDSTANKNSFYGYYTDTKTDKSGYKYNFVIITPECVKQAYIDGNGKSPDTGNPFWWYLKTYYGYSASERQSKGREIAEALLNGGLDMAKVPKAEDVSGTWTSPSSTKLYSSISDLKDEIIGIMCSSENLSSFDSTANQNSFYGYYVDETTDSKGLTYNFVIIIPECLKQAYIDGNGKSPDSGNPFWWYIKTYYGFSYSERQSKGREIAEALLNGGLDMTKAPKAEDVTDSWKASE